MMPNPNKIRKILNFNEWKKANHIEPYAMPIMYFSYLATEWDKEMWDHNDFVINFHTEKQAAKYYGKWWRFVKEYLDQITNKTPIKGRDMFARQCDEYIELKEKGEIK